MKKNKFTALTLLTCITVLCSGCDYFFGKKTNLDFIPKPDYDPRAVSYIPIQPAIKGLSYPVDVCVGWDQLIYVADAGAEQIVSYDISGTRLSAFHIPGLQAISQDRHLNLLAIGTLDTILNGQKYTLSTIYRLNLDNTSGYGLAHAVIINKTVHPFYFKTGLSDQDTKTTFKHIAVLSDNSFYVTRTGPNNSATQFGGPDDAVLQFSANSEFITPIQVTSSSGTFTNYFKEPSGITSYAQPPQSTGVNTSSEFVVTSLASYYPLKVQAINKTETPVGVFYTLDYLPPGDTTQADGFEYTPFRFSQPTSLTLTGDGTNYLFVVDAAKDSLFQFNAKGYEGINPPPGYNSKKNIKVSFGGHGSDLSHFNKPMGVAYYNKIVYVADAGNGRLLRFKLTTDIK